MRGEDRPKRHSWRNESGVAERLIARQLQATYPFLFHHRTLRQHRVSHILSLLSRLELAVWLRSTLPSVPMTQAPQTWPERLQ